MRIVNRNCSAWAQVGLYQLVELHEVTGIGVRNIGTDHFSQFWELAGVPQPSASAFADQDVERLLGLERISSMLLAFGYVEGALNSFAVEVLSASDCGLIQSDFSGSSYERAKLVLKKVGGISHVFGGPQWACFKKVAALRNQYLHAGGAIDRNNQGHMELLGQSGVTAVGAGDDGVELFSISENYLMTVLSTFRELVELIGEEISDRNRSEACEVNQ